MSRWWRAHDEAVDDPKLQQLPGDLFKAWFNLCCITSQNGGKLPDIGAIAFKLHTTKHKTVAILTALHSAGLLDKTETGFCPHNWDGRQFKSDVTDPTNAERQQRFRDRMRNAPTAVTETVTDKLPESDQIRSETDSNLSRSETDSNLSMCDLGKKANGWSPPKHGATSAKHQTVYVRKGTSEWEAYADDHRKTFGSEPVADETGGKWFPVAGSQVVVPEPSRLRRNH